MLLSFALSITAQNKDLEKKLLDRALRWDPPKVDAPFRSSGSSPPCSLSSVLEQSGARAEELIANLQNFTAQERIEYQYLTLTSHVSDSKIDAGNFDYTVVLEQHQKQLTVREDRKPERGSHSFPASSQDIGLPAIGLIFLPEFQADYEMNCQGLAKWNGHPTWLVHFQQRNDKPVRTVSFGGKDGPYPAKLKGRAWIAENSGKDSGEVMHLETSLTEEMPAINIRNWYLSIEYAPVQFRTQNARVWLPQAVDAYCDYGDHRTILYHTFTNFLLFSVQTDQVIDKPKNP
jgi:hypothetical protein